MKTFFIKSGNFLLKVTLLLLLSLSAINCSKDDDESEAPPQTPATVKDVYTSGHIQVNNKLVATYWKNNVPTTVTDGTKDASLVSIAVAGSDVYTCGGEGTGDQFIAKMWKNNVATNLSANPSHAAKIIIVGNDIYVAGVEKINGFNKAVYWKNGGTPITLSSTNGHDSDATSIEVVGTDIYVAGYDNGQPCYWKNNVKTTLASSGKIFSIQVVGSDVYCAGYIDTPAGYWKNSTFHQLGTLDGYANTIQVVGADVYTAGSEKNVSGVEIPKFWKNGTATELSTTGGVINGMEVTGTDVYSCGRLSSSPFNSGYWKNTELNQAPAGSNVRAIFLTYN
jgi:hypothetical protein